MSRKATTNQIDLIKKLLAKSGDDPEGYDFEDLSFDEAKDTIIQLKFDLELLS